jgi:hypothetical protein
MTTNFYDLLSYDEVTGLFVWKTSRGNVKKGQLAGSETSKGYLSIRINKKQLLLHRLAWFFVHGAWPIFDIDHINQNKKDNRIVNLRDVDKATNLQNQSSPQSNSKSKKRGVHWDRNKNKWVAQFSVNGRKKHIGYFDDADEAYKSYLGKKQELPNAVERLNV